MRTATSRVFLKITLIVSIMHLVLLELHAQIPTVQDCMGAIPVCQDVYVEVNSYSGEGNYPNEVYEDLPCNSACPGSCLAGETNSVWYIWTVQASGMLRLTIDPVNDADDYDWAVYDLTDLRCDDIYTNYALMQKSCNAYGQAPNGNTGISTANGGVSNCNNCGGTNKWNADLMVHEGRTYVLIIENWSGTTQGYTLDFGASSAIIYDDVRPELATVLNDEITCGTNEVIVEFTENVKCESVQPNDFVLSGPGGPYTVLDAQGETCMIGGEMEKTYTLILDKPINSDGDYSVQLTPLCFVYDACNNFALGNTITFNVSLGAPVIQEGAMVISSATCGLSNGSITGLQIAGTPPYTYVWKNSSGDIVGNTLNLSNVPTGDYTLEVSDQETCLTVGGPYFVDQSGAPAVNDVSIVITGANWGANNGHITGLVITGNEPLTYLWTDESNTPVGSTPELHDVYSGNYFLLVTDTYGCDTLAGPYFVQQIGGPLGVQATADPETICAGEATQLNATAFGGTGTYSFQWVSNPPGFTSDLQSPLVFPAVTTEYTVSISDGYNVTGASITITVYPVPTSSAGYDQTIPYGTSTTLYGAAGGGTSTYYFAWEPADQLINPTAQNPATKNLYQTTLFRVRATDSNTGCQSGYDTVVVALDGGPLGVTVSLQKDTICKGQATVFTAYGFGGNYDDYTYTWSEGSTVLKVESGALSTLDITPATDGLHNYNIKIFDGFNEFVLDFDLFVAPTPAFTISGSPQIIACPADTVLLVPSINLPDAEYYWSNGSTDRAIRLASTGIGFSVRTLYLTVTNTLGCTYTDSVTVVFDFAACFGVQEYHSFPEVKVYPNPNTGRFVVELEDGDAFYGIEVLNAQGACIFRKDIRELGAGRHFVQLDLSGQPSGVYLVRAVHERFIHYQKVMLQ